jgi:hypothetical protein
VVGVVTQINKTSIFSISDGTRMPTEVHSCHTDVSIDDCVLLRHFTVCWGEDNLAYLEDIGGEGKVDILNMQ